jgi:hypothetical protein
VRFSPPIFFPGARWGIWKTTTASCKSP